MRASAVRKLRNPDTTLRFGVFWPYSQTNYPSAEVARRNPDVMDLQNHLDLARALESVGFDFALIADGYAAPSEAGTRIGFQDPSTNAVVLAAPLMQVTKHLGFLSTMHTRFLHPVVIARLGAQLDWISGGRWGWNIVNGFRPHEARLFGFESLDHDGGYDLSDEVMQIVQALWAKPPQSIDHEGAHFNVHGQIRGPRPDLLPLLVSAASSERGRAFASKYCDYLFANPSNAADVIALTGDLERYAQAAGRADIPRILILCDIFVREEPGRAHAEYEELVESADPDARKAWAAQVARVQREKKIEDIMKFLGTADEVAEQIVALARASPTGGLIFRMPLWGASEVLGLRAVFERLENTGVWLTPNARDYSW